MIELQTVATICGVVSFAAIGFKFGAEWRKKRYQEDLNDLYQAVLNASDGMVPARDYKRLMACMGQCVPMMEQLCFMLQHAHDRKVRMETVRDAKKYLEILKGHLSDPFIRAERTPKKWGE